jgi:hypothetical protein
MAAMMAAATINGGTGTRFIKPHRWRVGQSSTGETFENRNPADTRDVVGIFRNPVKPTSKPQSMQPSKPSKVAARPSSQARRDHLPCSRTPDRTEEGTHAT